MKLTKVITWHWLIAVIATVVMLSGCEKKEGEKPMEPLTNKYVHLLINLEGMEETIPTTPPAKEVVEVEIWFDGQAHKLTFEELKQCVRQYSR